MNLVIDLREAVSDFTGATQAMTNMDYDLNEIVVALAEISLRRYDPMAVNEYVFSYQQYGQSVQHPNNDGMVLSTAISMLANRLLNAFMAMRVYNTQGASHFQIHQYVNELLILKPVPVHI